MTKLALGELRRATGGFETVLFTPRAAALRQARVSGGDLQNRLPSAAFGGAIHPQRRRRLRLICAASVVR